MARMAGYGSAVLRAAKSLIPKDAGHRPALQSAVFIQTQKASFQSLQPA